MSLAIRWGENNAEDGGFLYFDAVTAYTQDYTGSVSAHPIDAGASIVDHYIKNNAKFTLSGVITGVDVSTGSYLIQDGEGTFAFNSRFPPTKVSVNSTDNSVLNRFIPASVSQFLPETTPDIVMDSVRTNIIGQVRDVLIDLTSGSKLNEKTGQFDSNIQTVKLYEYEGTRLSRPPIENLVITSIRFNEDANTGSALYCDISFEQVTFAFLKKTELPKDVQQPIKKKASPKKSIGKCDSTVKDTDSASNTDPQGKKDSIKDSANDVDPERAQAAEL